jgi:cytochrome P450
LNYLVRLVADRRAHPGDPARDVLTRLIEGESDGERLSESELPHNVIFICNAGHETTTNLIGNALFALLEWPEEKARPLTAPALIRPAVEEVLRFESSNQLGNRVTTRPVELGGVAMPAGTFVTIGIGAANRDRAEFPDPDRLDMPVSPTGIWRSALAHVCAGLNVAPGGPHCRRPVCGALSGLSAEWPARARRPRALSRLPVDSRHSRLKAEPITPAPSRCP